VDIVAGGTCDLMQGDMSFPPPTPAIGSLYVADCGGGQLRLADVNTPAVASGDLLDDYVGPAGNIRFYQIECGCLQGIDLYKNTATGKVAVDVY